MKFVRQYSGGCSSVKNPRQEQVKFGWIKSNADKARPNLFNDDHYALSRGKDKLYTYAHRVIHSDSDHDAVHTTMSMTSTVKNGSY